MRNVGLKHTLCIHVFLKEVSYNIPCSTGTNGERIVTCLVLASIYFFYFIDGYYRILYEEVDESEVDVISIASSTAELNGVEHYRYPRPGSTNATCKLKLLEFSISGAERTVCPVDSYSVFLMV